jgi:hypothetical protein
LNTFGYDGQVGAVIKNNNGVCGCCGANYRDGPTQGKKWKNQYGEGFCVAKPGADPYKNNSKGILLMEGKHGEAGLVEKNSVHHVQTKNGILTVGIREAW